MNIHILTAPIGCGKSTLLLNWLKSNPEINTNGFISIHERQLNEMRKLLLLPELTEVPFESEIGEIQIGKFKFLSSAFRQGIDALKPSVSSSTVIIDEIGKLELLGQGFEPDLTLILEKLQCDTLIVVVRLSLISQVIQKYPVLKNAKVNLGPWLPRNPKVNGLVLGGGTSTRMSQPKLAMNYHGVPQYIHVGNLIDEVIDGELYVNVPADHVSVINSPNVLVDEPQFTGNGPISGLLSAMELNSSVSWLVVGVDYPQLSVYQLNELFTAYQISGRTVCFMNPQSGYLEPLVALYSATDLENLKSFLDQGNQSLRHFLGQVNCLVLPMSPGDSLTSVDNPVDAEKFKSQISNK